MSAGRTFEEWKASAPLTLESGRVEWAKAAWLASRKAALEEAARVCEQMHEREDDNCGEAAHEILALINK